MGEGEEEEIKPRWMDMKCCFYEVILIPSILIFLYPDKIIDYSKLFLESKIDRCKAFVEGMT